MRSIFAILLPTKFPSAKLGTPETEAFIDTINSGDDVPNAITVIPITNLDILNDFARETAPLTSNSAPPSRIIKPKTSKT